MGLKQLLMSRSIIVMSVFALNVAQANPVQQMLQEINVANQSAAEHLKSGNLPLARLSLLAVMPGLQRLFPAASQSPVKEVFDAYADVRYKAWPGAAPQLTQPALQAFLKFYEQNKSELARYGREFDIKTTLPNGKQQYYRAITGVLAQRPGAWKLAGEWAMQAPPPDQLVTNPQIYQQLQLVHSIPKIFNNIAFGPAYAVEHAQQRVIPENIQLAQAALKRAGASTAPKEIWRAVNEAREAVALVDTIDASVKGLVDVSALVAPVAGIHKSIDAETARANKLFDKQVDANRMPGNKNWQGKLAKSELLKQIEKAYQNAFPDDRIVKVQLRSENFTERAEAWWEKDVIYSAWVGYVKAAVAVRQPNGDHRVFIKRFSRTLNGDGSWSPLGFNKTLGSYLIRQENI